MCFDEASKLTEHSKDPYGCAHDTNESLACKQNNSEGLNKCDQCDEDFSSPQNLATHQNNHLNDVDIQRCTPLNSDFDLQVSVTIQNSIVNTFALLDYPS